MNENNSNTSDKITIKVRHSDEDYHDITIDWSNESFDYRKQLFHQLSAYTGIPVEYQSYISVEITDPQRSAGLQNQEFINEERRTISELDTKERAMDSFHDGDCFFFRTSLISNFVYPSIYCSYGLMRSMVDLVNETDCNFLHCHHLSSRFFTQKFAHLIKSEHLQTLLDPARLDPPTWEAATRMRLDLNIEHLTCLQLQCRAALEVWPNPFIDITYLRYRG